jgi:hypothetical protein
LSLLAVGSTPAEYFPSASEIRLTIEPSSRLSFPIAYRAGAENRVRLTTAFVELACDVVLLTAARFDTNGQATAIIEELARCLSDAQGAYSSDVVNACLDEHGRPTIPATAAALSAGELSLLNELFTGLMQAVFLHEIAHVAFGHLEAELETNGQIEEFELAAEQFAMHWTIGGGFFPYGLSYLYQLVGQWESANPRVKSPTHQPTECRRTYLVLTSAELVFKFFRIVSYNRRLLSDAGVAAVQTWVDDPALVSAPKTDYRAALTDCDPRFTRSIAALTEEVGVLYELLDREGWRKHTDPKEIVSLLSRLTRAGAELEFANGLLFEILEAVMVSSNRIGFKYQEEGYFQAVLELATTSRLKTSSRVLGRIAMDIGTAIQFGEYDTATLNNLAVAVDGAGGVRLRSSKYFLEMAVYFRPELAQAYYHLAAVEAALGRCDRAAQYAHESSRLAEESMRAPMFEFAQLMQISHDRGVCASTGEHILVALPGLAD